MAWHGDLYHVPSAYGDLWNLGDVFFLSRKWSQPEDFAKMTTGSAGARAVLLPLSAFLSEFVQISFLITISISLDYFFCWFVIAAG